MSVADGRETNLTTNETIDGKYPDAAGACVDRSGGRHNTGGRSHPNTGLQSDKEHINVMGGLLCEDIAPGRHLDYQAQRDCHREAGGGVAGGSVGDRRC